MHQVALQLHYKIILKISTSVNLALIRSTIKSLATIGKATTHFTYTKGNRHGTTTQNSKQQKLVRHRIEDLPSSQELQPLGGDIVPKSRHQAWRVAPTPPDP